MLETRTRRRVQQRYVRVGHYEAVLTLTTIGQLLSTVSMARIFSFSTPGPRQVAASATPLPSVRFGRFNNIYFATELIIALHPAATSGATQSQQLTLGLQV